MRKRDQRRSDPSSQLILDLAASRPLGHATPTEEELGLTARHGLMGIMALHPQPSLSGPARAAFTRLKTRQMVMETHLSRILPRLYAAGIAAAVVKGPQIARQAYNDPDYRTYTDIDLLVARSDLSRTLDVLAEDPSIPMIPPKTPAADKRNVLVTDRSGISFMIDLHWDLFSYSQLQGCATGATEQAWQGAERIESPWGPLSRLPEAINISFLCTHAVLDHRFRLILFRDLAELARKGIDWEDLARTADRWRLRSFVYTAFHIAERYVDAPVPPGFLSELRPRSAAVTAVDRLLDRIDVVRFDGHRVHPLNLAFVLMHDDPTVRRRLLFAAPLAFPEWKRRVENPEAPRRHRRGPAPRSGDTRLIVLVSSNRRRGAEVFGERLARGLADTHGMQTELIALAQSEDGPHVDATVLKSAPYDLPRFHLKPVASLRRHLTETQPEIVFANGGATLRYAVAALAGQRNRPILVYASIGEPAYWLRGSFHRHVQAVLHRQADAILAVSEMTKSQLVEILRLDGHRIHVAHTGVPAEFLEIEPEPRDPDELHILFLGNLSREKDPKLAVDTFARVHRETPARLRLVGGGPLTRVVAEHARALGLARRVELTGSVDDVRPHLAWADVLLSTSLTEGFPGVILEAAAACVPAVACDVGGTRETMIDGETGILVGSRDLDDHAIPVIGLANDEGRRQKMGANGRALVADRFLLEHAIQRHHDIFRLILDDVGVWREPARARSK